MAYVNREARLVAAIMVGKSNALDIAARRVQTSVKAVAAQHRDTGNYASKVHILNVPGLYGVGKLVRDRLIVADDEGATPIEFGFIVRFEKSRRVKYVPGLHIMRRGLERV
jgi:hypothetical protein